MKRPQKPKDIVLPLKDSLKTNKAMKELKFIHDSLLKAQGLEVEFMWSALWAVKANPKISIEEAVCAGLEEWDV